MAVVIERVLEALNRHDLAAFLESFDPSYQSEQPAHPNRDFGGKEQVRKNWSGMFESFPDFKAELLRHVTEGPTVWSEWRWTATGLDIYGRGRGADRVGSTVYRACRGGWPGHRRSHEYHYGGSSAGRRCVLGGSQSHIASPDGKHLHLQEAFPIHPDAGKITYDPRIYVS